MTHFTIKSGIIVPKTEVLKELISFEMAEFEVNPTERQAHIIKLLEKKLQSIEA
jgi:hypothetical protein